MTERKVIKVKRQAIRRARLKKVGTVAAMLPLVMSKGAPVATLIRGRHGEATLGIEQVVEMAEQEISDVVLPETPAEEVLEEKEYGGVEEREVEEAPTPFEAPQYFVAPYFSEGGLTSFEGDDAYLDIVPLAVNWDARGTWPWAEVLNVRWISATRVEIKFSRTLSDNSTRGGGQIKDLELKVEVGDDVFTDVQLISQSGNEIYTIELEGISQEAFGSITIYFGDPDGRPGKDNSFRLQGGYGVLHPNPFFPIVITEKHIRLGRVADKFVNDPLAADVVQWPQLALTEIGFSGSLDFIDKIADIVFASTD
ncbi:MAG: LPXTG cell wall anchor domain-containing protein, partial [Lactococcus garvieae]